MPWDNVCQFTSSSFSFPAKYYYAFETTLIKTARSIYLDPNCKINIYQRCIIPFVSSRVYIPATLLTQISNHILPTTILFRKQNRKAYSVQKKKVKKMHRHAYSKTKCRKMSYFILFTCLLLAASKKCVAYSIANLLSPLCAYMAVLFFYFVSEWVRVWFFSHNSNDITKQSIQGVRDVFLSTCFFL